MPMSLIMARPVFAALRMGFKVQEEGFYADPHKMQG
jgi:hypothetical protein